MILREKKRRKKIKSIKIRELNHDTISYCGVFCGGCPSYHKGTCNGCRSTIKKQKRTSKWNCRKRLCCIDKKIFSCGDCADLDGCSIRKSLVIRYKEKYNIGLDSNVKNLTDFGPDTWLKNKIQKYACSGCGGVVSPYDLKCIQCGLDF